MDTLLPLEIDFDNSHGSYLVDKQSGEEYLDFFSMYSSLAFGYNHKVFDKSFEQQVIPLTKLRFATNALQSSLVNKYQELFSQHVFSPHMHFTCTGALAVESALKAAIDYKKISDPIILSIENSFHGVNSWGLTTSLVGFTAERLAHMPRLAWPSLSLDNMLTYIENVDNKHDLSKVVAVIVEPIQCTNGDIYLDKSKLRRLYQLCREHDICFILDEIQTGFATTGKLWYYQFLGFEPDILVFGKKAQLCGIVLSEQYSPILSLAQKKLQVTFDGDLIDLFRSYTLLNYIIEHDVLADVLKGEKILHEHLGSLVCNYRAKGYLIAFDFATTVDRDNFVVNCFKQKLIVNKAGTHTIRLRPNLAVTEQELLTAIAIIKSLL